MAYKIELSYNMKRQGLTSPDTLFDTEQKAYEYGIGRWGSAYYNDKRGWSIVEVEGD